MDAHAQRVTQPFRDAIADYESGQASVMDVCRRAEMAASALDNANQPLRELLESAAAELDYVAHAVLQEEQAAQIRRIVAPALEAIDEQL